MRLLRLDMELNGLASQPSAARDNANHLNPYERIIRPEQYCYASQIHQGLLLVVLSCSQLIASTRLSAPVPLFSAGKPTNAKSVVFPWQPETSLVTEGAVNPTQLLSILYIDSRLRTTDA